MVAWWATAIVDVSMRTRLAGVLVCAVALASGCSALREVRGGSTTVAPPPTTTTTTTAVVAPTSSTTTTTTVALPYPVPVLGGCRAAIFAPALAEAVDTRPTAPCGGPHGSETVAVLLDAFIAIDEHPALRDDVPEGLVEQAARNCQVAFDGYVGLPPLGSRGRVSSALVPVWFVPTPEEWDLGARWLRCDAAVVPVGGQSGTFAGAMRGVLAGGQVPLPLTACFDREVRRTRCDAAHAYEAIVDAVVDAGECDPAAATAIGIGSMADQPALVTELVESTCMVAAADGRDLNDSVRGIAAMPPPLVLAR